MGKHVGALGRRPRRNVITEWSAAGRARGANRPRSRGAHRGGHALGRKTNVSYVRYAQMILGSLSKTKGAKAKNSRAVDFYLISDLRLAAGEPKQVSLGGLAGFGVAPRLRVLVGILLENHDM